MIRLVHVRWSLVVVVVVVVKVYSSMRETAPFQIGSNGFWNQTTTQYKALM